jgi:ABC-type glycerol-3-phosphate transport system substrate-binding protein
MGGYQVLNDSWFGKVGEDYKLVLRDDLFKKATMEANKWYREGLIADTQFTDTREQIVEKLVAGRTALVYYDQSKDDENHFRTILRESFPGDSYEMVVVDDKYLFPPANGLSPDKIYADIQGTVGWNVTCITTKATNPQRIFDLYSYFLTKEGSINMMYGPKGDLWDELDSTGNPILKTAEGDLSSTERDRLGLWFWNMPGHSDNVDLTKFAVNEAQPADKRSWVISNQANLFTPLMKISDEYTGIADIIDNQSDTGIKRKLCEDYIHANMPKVIMASSEADASKLYDDLIAFCDKNGMAEIETLYTEKYKANCELQGGSVFK